MEYYFYKKHIQLPAMKGNGKTKSMDLFFIHTVPLALVMYLITFFGKNKICVNSQITDNHGWILILDVTIDGFEFILVNFYNANTELTTKSFEWSKWTHEKGQYNTRKANCFSR